MKFLADVNIPQSVITHLSRTYDVLDLKTVDRVMPDDQVIELARSEERIILTFDKDFISFMQYPRFQTPTIVVRLSSLLPQNVIRYIDELLQYKHEIVPHSLTIVYDNEAIFHMFAS